MKEIAIQSGLSLASVDRVLNKREGVLPQTVRRVEQAIRELDRQRNQIGLAGRKLVLDVVLDSPLRFANLVRHALEMEFPMLRPAVFRARYAEFESATTQELVDTLEHLGRRGSHGVFLTSQDKPDIVEAVNRLHARGIPVVTLATDLPGSRRKAYVGMDNYAAGATAAYLLGMWVEPSSTQVLVSLGSMRFRGHEEREVGFRQYLRNHHPQIEVIEVGDGVGLYESTFTLAEQALRTRPHINAVYSIGGANMAILHAFQKLQRPCMAFVGHDLDEENVQLLRQQRLNAVLHHDLRHDVRVACRHLLHAHGLCPALEFYDNSNVQVITPCNIPSLELDRPGRQGGGTAVIFGPVGKP